jgi:hypothetical protein
MCPYEKWFNLIQERVLIDNDSLYEQCHRPLEAVDYESDLGLPFQTHDV